MKALAAVLALGCALLAASVAQAQSYPILNGYGQVQAMCDRPQATVHVACDAQVYVGWAPTGLAAITGTLTSSSPGTSTALVGPLAGRPFSGSLSITGTATVQLERQAPGDTNWYPMFNDLGQQRYAFQTNGTATVSATVLVTEPMPNASFRWHVTACSACSVPYRLEQ